MRKFWVGLAFAGALATGSAAANISDQAVFERTIAESKAAMLVDTVAAMEKAKVAERMASALSTNKNRETAIATAKWLQGEAFIRLNDIDHAAPLVAEALRLSKREAPQDKLTADILLSSGGVHQMAGDVAAALSDYQAAYGIYKATDDARDCARALLSIASLYGDANNFATSLRYLNEALETYGGDPSFLVSIYNNRASNLQDLGRYKEAEGQYAKVLMLSRDMRSPLLEARILGNIARVRLKAGDVAGGTRAVREALSLSSSGEAQAWRPQLLAIAAQASLQRKDFTQAIALIEQRFAGVDLSTTTLPMREAHQTAYEAYRAAGLNEKAIVHLAALKRLDDQATKLATSANTALAAARFDFANQELRIQTLRNNELQRSVAFEQARARTQRYVFLGAAGTTVVIIAMLAIGLFTIRRSRDQVRAANDDLAVSNSALGKALAAKTEFLATTSHEIRTPLNGILGMTQVMLADPKLNGDVRDRIGVVHGAGVTMRALVDDILDVAKMETGKLTVEEAPFDLRSTLVDATRLWDEQARAKGLAFTVDTTDAPGRIVGDAARVRQIAFNLLSNAIKFTHQGSVAIRVVTRGDRYEIIVSDTGIGIDSAKREEVFESFRQADTSTTRQFGGTGLGLSICRNLARAMKGDVRVESVIGEGATFTVTLPLVPAPAADLPCVEEDETGRPGALILDANPITRAMFRSLIAPHAGQVVVSGTVDDAEECLSRGGIALMLIDDATVRRADDPVAAVRALGRAARDAGTVSALLWAGDVPAGLEGLTDLLIAKPVAGRALVTQLFTALPAKDEAPPLVSQAA